MYVFSLVDSILNELVKESYLPSNVVTIEKLKATLLSSHENQGEKNQKLVSLKGKKRIIVVQRFFSDKLISFIFNLFSTNM